MTRTPTKARLLGVQTRESADVVAEYRRRLAALALGAEIEERQELAPAASIHVGTDGAAMVLADLRPGDEVVIVVSDASVPAAAMTSETRASSSSAPSSANAPGSDSTRTYTSSTEPSSAAVSPTPLEGNELMIFRQQAP